MLALQSMRTRNHVQLQPHQSRRSGQHCYSASKGITGLRRAQTEYYERRFGVKLNPDTQIVATHNSRKFFDTAV